uniref:cysteine desulfurase-like protein n=1 Tax=Nocardioides sp. TaxID=35761 RepID=UPI002B272291
MDVTRLRAAFPALTTGAGAGLVRLDGPGGSLVPQVVADATAAAMTSGMCQRGALTAPEQLTEATTIGAREAMGDFLGSDPRGIVFGRSMTALTFDLARTLSASWGPGDEVVVTRLDHDSNIRPWVVAAERVGATVRWLGFDPETAELDDVRPLLNDRTRLVAVTAASNLFGTRPDVVGIAAAAHEVGAVVHVDVVHLAAHAAVDRVALGADVVTCSPYKFFGPHLGVLAADPAFLETLQPDKLLPSTDAVPERFEIGTLPYEQLAAVTAAVDFIASFATIDEHAPRRERLVSAFAEFAAHEDALLARLLIGLDRLSHVHVLGRPASRTPTVLLRVDGHEPRAVYEHLAGLGVIAPAGSFYAIEASRHAGLGDTGGVRVGLSPYTTAIDLDRLIV